MRYSMPLPTGRGVGLGNEMIPWAKAHIGARELDLKCLHPAWGINPRRYWRDFGTSRVDWIGHRLLRASLPVFRVTDALVESTGHRFDYAAAMRSLAPTIRRRSPIVVTHESMAGGVLGVRSSRRFLQAQTIFHPRALALSGARREEPTGLQVVVHIRAGDFIEREEPPRPGEFNVRIPMSWYEGVVQAVRRSVRSPITVTVLSDGDSEEIRSLCRSTGAAPPAPSSVLADLATMAHADLLVCSVSSFSLQAAFLSDSPYVWFSGHLNDRDGWMSIWGHEPGQQGGPTDENSTPGGSEPWGRGFAMSGHEEELAAALTAVLELRLRLGDRRRDLVYFGALPDESRTAPDRQVRT